MASQPPLRIPEAIRKAHGLQRQGKLEEAARLYQAVLEVRPQHFDALHLLGVLRSQQGRLEAAVKLISRALERQPGSAEARANLDIVLAGLNHHGEAISRRGRRRVPGVAVVSRRAKGIKTFAGTVCSGFGDASRNFAAIVPLIEARTGLANLVHGTLNVRIPEDYIVEACAVVLPVEYWVGETLKLQRCLAAGYKAVILRPITHETRPGWGHGKNHFELMSHVHFRQTLDLQDEDVIEVEVEGDDAWWASGL